MNRIFPAVLLISILAFPAFSQEPDSIAAKSVYDTITANPAYDTLTANPAYDSIYRNYMLQTDNESQDTTLRLADTLVVEEPDFSHSPSRAIMFALVLPGLGQAYNRKYFKMPIVWAAMGAVGYAIVYNTKNYRQSTLDYALTPDDINERYLQFWRRNMELSYIGLIVVYALQVVDAYVDAQLYSWDVNENLSMRVMPSLQPLLTPTSLTGQSYGLTCSFNLKGR